MYLNVSSLLFILATGNIWHTDRHIRDRYLTTEDVSKLKNNQITKKLAGRKLFICEMEIKD